MNFLYFFLNLIFLLYICSYILLLTQEHYSINCHLLPLLNQFFLLLFYWIFLIDKQPWSYFSSWPRASQVVLVVKNPPESAGEIRDSYGNPFKYSCLENSMDRGALCAIVHEVTKSWTWFKQLSMHAWNKSISRPTPLQWTPSFSAFIYCRTIPNSYLVIQSPIYPLSVS